MQNISESKCKQFYAFPTNVTTIKRIIKRIILSANETFKILQRNMFNSKSSKFIISEQKVLIAELLEYLKSSETGISWKFIFRID